tara:strand:- start:373 stop:696 length:324 start_codon:yes stop_codon:yes gene_type:complete
MSGRKSRSKGARWEREVSRTFSEAFGVDAHRGDQRRKGSDAPDVDWRGCPWWIEAKVGQRPNIQKAVHQSLEATDGRTIVVVSKKDREEPLVTMLMSDWIELAKKLT